MVRLHSSMLRGREREIRARARNSIFRLRGEEEEQGGSFSKNLPAAVGPVASNSRQPYHGRPLKSFRISTFPVPAFSNCACKKNVVGHEQLSCFWPAFGIEVVVRSISLVPDFDGIQDVCEMENLNLGGCAIDLKRSHVTIQW